MMSSFDRCSSGNRTFQTNLVPLCAESFGSLRPAVLSPCLRVPPPNLFHCPLGHAVAFLSRTPEEYPNGGVVCDSCHRAMDEAMVGRGLYHCTERGCRASAPATGWDMCTDCASHQLLRAVQFPITFIDWWMFWSHYSFPSKTMRITVRSWFQSFFRKLFGRFRFSHSRLLLGNEAIATNGATSSASTLTATLSTATTLATSLCGLGPLSSAQPPSFISTAICNMSPSSTAIFRALPFSDLQATASGHAASPLSTPTRNESAKLKYPTCPVLDILPLELLLATVTFLQIETLKFVRNTCKRFRHVVGIATDQHLRDCPSALCGICLERCTTNRGEVAIGHRQVIAAMCANCHTLFHEACLIFPTNQPAGTGAQRRLGPSPASSVSSLGHGSDWASVQTPFCPNCNSPLQPGHQMHVMTINCNTPLDCGDDGTEASQAGSRGRLHRHAYFMQVPHIPIIVTGAGTSTVNGVYWPTGIPSDGVTTYVNLPPPSIRRRDSHRTSEARQSTSAASSSSTSSSSCTTSSSLHLPSFRRGSQEDPSLASGPHSHLASFFHSHSSTSTPRIALLRISPQVEFGDLIRGQQPPRAMSRPPTWVIATVGNAEGFARDRVHYRCTCDTMTPPTEGWKVASRGRYPAPNVRVASTEEELAEFLQVHSNGCGSTGSTVGGGHNSSASAAQRGIEEPMSSQFFRSLRRGSAGTGSGV